MNVCPICQWPLNSSQELKVHMEIKHPSPTKSDYNELLDDDGVYIDDVVIHYPYEDDDDLDGCPKCGNPYITWQGGDTVVNVGRAATFTRVDWYTCEECGHKWSESEDYG